MPSAAPFRRTDVHVVDDQDRDVPNGEPSEMVIRHSAERPDGFFQVTRRCVEQLRPPDAASFHTGDASDVAPTACCIS